MKRKNKFLAGIMSFCLFTSMTGAVNLYNVLAKDEKEAKETRQMGEVKLYEYDNVNNRVIRIAGNNEKSGVTEEFTNNLPNKYITPDLPPIRDQGEYGTCWTFGFSAVAEMGIKKLEGKGIDLSELQLAYFAYNAVADPLGGTIGDYYMCTDGNPLDCGGNNQIAMEAYATWMCGTTEDILPYSMAEEAAKNGLSSDYAYIKDSVHLRNIYTYSLTEEKDEIKKVIQEKGAVGINYYHAWSEYDNIHNSYNLNYSGGMDEVLPEGGGHAVAVVGWDDDFPAENFKTPAKGNGAWLVRNSWGYEGEDVKGYFWMSYYCGALVSYDGSAYSIECVTSDNDKYYDKNYQYDGVNKTSSYMAKKYANEFTVSGDRPEKIMAVSIQPGFNYVSGTVKIYKDIIDNSNPESGTLAAIQNFYVSNGVYMTIDLDTPVNVAVGSRFAVVVEMQAESGGPGIQTMCMEKGDLGKESFYNIEKEQSYVMNYNGEWEDFVDVESEGNLRIKAFTNYNDEIIAPEIQSVTNEHGAALIKWSPSSDAVKYKVYRKSITESAYTYLGTTAATEYTDTTHERTTGTYYYRVVSVKADKTKGSKSERFKYRHTHKMCGKDAYYYFDSKTGVLTVSGSGRMKDYSTMPWEDIKTKIKAVVIGSKITYIGSYTFNRCSKLTKVVGCKALTGIGYNAFSRCTSLKTVSGCEKVKTIDSCAFAFDKNLVTIGSVSGKITLNSNVILGYKALYECKSKIYYF